MTTILLLGFGVSVLAASMAQAQPAQSSRRLKAGPTAQAIRVDGVLDESPWKDAPLARDFTQNEPNEFQPATEQTEVRVLYDADYLYFGVTAFDSHPDGGLVHELRKDFNPANGDALGIVLDTFHDRRNGYMFIINPAGAKWDAQMLNEGREQNTSWDAVWDVATRRTESGWQAEIAIPFKTLKFASADPQTWGVNFLRRLRRRNEDSYWAPLPRIHNLTRVSMAGTLEGLQGIRAGGFRIKPYALASIADAGVTSGDLDLDVGLDAKFTVSAGLTLDVTLNTDFSQVEADEQQINLTRFSLFFPEKRDFFLENSGIFQISAGGSGGPGRQNAAPNDLIVFFSRRIGLSDDGAAIPLLAGSRLTGRSGPYTVGVMNVQQRALDDRVPATNFTAVRARRDVLSNSNVGVMLLNKSAFGADAPGRNNEVVAGDGNFRFFRNLELSTFVVQTFGGDDGTGRRGGDGAFRGQVSWRDRTWDLRASYLTIGEDFRDDMGFVPRTGIHKAEAFTGLTWRPRLTSRWVRELFPHWQVVNIARHGGGGLDARYFDYHLPVFFQNGTFAEVGFNTNVEHILQPFPINRRRNLSIPAGRYDFDEAFVTFQTNPSARLAGSARWSSGEFYDGTRDAYSSGLNVRANERLSLSGNVSLNDVHLPEGVFHTTLVSGRVNYSFSTRVFVNALIQYNSDARQWSSNVRFNLIHRPLSDLFVVYNDRRDSRDGTLADRALVVKGTWLVSF